MEAEQIPTERKKKAGFISRLRRSRKSKSAEELSTPTTPPPTKKIEDDVPITPPLTPVDEIENAGEYGASVTRDGFPVISSQTDQFPPSAVRETDSIPSPIRSGEAASRTTGLSQKSSRRRGRQNVVLEKPPTARASAFAGPPRYDWIDIETAAAVKVQAAYRRNKVMWDLEKQGKSTAAMRNRMRERKSRQRMAASEDVPSALKLCGVGLLFGDATEEERTTKEAMAKAQFQEKKRQEADAEEKRRRLRLRKKAGGQLHESVEVVDFVELPGESQ